MGTELYYNGPSEFGGPSMRPVWTEDLSVLWTTLRDNQNHLAMPTELQPGRVLRRIRACPYTKLEDLYGPFLKFLENRLGYTEGTDFLPFGYDWRKSNQATAMELAARLREETAKRPGQIKLVAHSMGGLIVRLLLMDSRNADIAERISVFVQVGSPIKGSPRALPTLKKRPQFGRVCDLIFRAADHISPESYHQLMLALGTFPSLYELLPHEQEVVVLTRAGEQLTAHSQKLWQFVRPEMLADLHELQAKVRSWNAAYLNCIYSTDINTDAMYYTEHMNDLKTIARVAGDGTVIVASAADGASMAQRHEINDKIDHGDLTNAPRVQELIERLLR
jgi:hypothetical protein